MATVIIPAFSGTDSFVFIPACCYRGNQFPVLKYGYPPMFRPGDAAISMPVTITDIPRLNPDGSGKIEVTTGDAATPCIGVFSPAEKRGLLVFTPQQIQGKNIGLAYEAGNIRLTWPAKREQCYRICRMIPNDTPWTDEDARIPYRLLDFPCEDPAQFYRVFFENRKIMGLDCQRPETLPFDRQFALHREKFNQRNWNEALGIYQVVTTDQHSHVWQPGWVGGAISGYPLMKLGGNQELEREMRTLGFLFSTQQESGFFHGIVDSDGTAFGDGFDTEGAESFHLIRKSADVLYFLLKHFRLMEERKLAIPEDFLAGTRKLADAFVTLFDRYGQFGQFVDVYTGDILVGGSEAAAIVCGALAQAHRFFDCPDYLRVAEESAEFFYQTALRRGFTTGGPGEILQCPDSESAFGLLESFVVLYEITGCGKWLTYAKECAHYCSSWVVSYNYQFPPDSEFGRLGIQSVGSVFANVQNKHAAPGICTLSGDSLYKLWKWTADPLYLELLKDIALTIGQYISTDERPICDRYIDPSLPDPERCALIDAHRMPEGFINERVNLSDWEGPNRVGGIFNGSCWPEASNLLTLAEVIPLLEGLL